MFGSYLIMNVPESNFVTDAVAAYFHWIVYYAAGSLIGMAYMITKQPFITPEVRHPKCNFCGGPMSTVSLKCESCQSKSDKGH